MPHFSKVSKMPCDAWGIPSMFCKLGSILRKSKELTPCSKCYTFFGPVSWKASQKRLQENFDEYLEDNEKWKRKIIAYLEYTSPRYFRWFHSGDIQSIQMLKDIAEIAEKCKEVQFWLPTQERKMVWKFLQEGQKIPENLNIRISCSVVDKPNISNVIQGVTWSVVCLEEQIDFECVAQNQDGECQACRACWDKSVNIVSYPLKIGRNYRPKSAKKKK